MVVFKLEGSQVIRLLGFKDIPLPLYICRRAVWQISLSARLLVSCLLKKSFFLLKKVSCLLKKC